MIKFSKYENDLKMFNNFLRFAWQIIWKFLFSEYWYDFMKILDDEIW